MRTVALIHLLILYATYNKIVTLALLVFESRFIGVFNMAGIQTMENHENS
jgi:hypothetical protein